MMDREFYCSRIAMVANLLMEEEIPFTVNNCGDGWQLRFPWDNGDVICHSGSYGSYKGMVESYGFPWDGNDVTTADPYKMAQYIINYYHEIHN